MRKLIDYLGGEDEHPPSSKAFSESVVGFTPTHLSVDDIKGKQGVGGFWNKLLQPILYPAGTSLCSRCCGFLMDI